MRVYKSFIAAFGGSVTRVVLLAGFFLLPAACMDATEQPGASLASVTDQSLTIPDGEDCATVSAWVHANQANLPTAYVDIVRFPVVYRRAIFDSLSPAEKSSLWQQRFQAYLAANPGLSAEQIAFIDELDATMSPELFAEEDAAANQEMLARAAALEAEAALLFTQDQARELLAQLGPEPGPVVPQGAVDCHCSTRSDWCDNNLDCKEGANNCRERGGCGTLFMYTCNGMCGP